MALHIQMSEEAEAELRKTAMRNRISSMAASLLLLLIGGLILFFTALVIMQQQPSSFIAYTPPAEDLPPTMEPTVQEVSAKASPASTDVSPTIIVAHGATSPVQASINLDATDGLDLSPSLDISMGEGMGGLGDGLGDGGSGMGSSKGGGSALTGTFYDLKQTRSGASTEVASNPHKSNDVIKDFLSKNWSTSVLSKYWQSPTKLYASNFYLPQLAAEYSPYAYQCSDKVQAKAVVAVYRGKVRAPKSGYFRFVGGGDEVLAVRFANKTVLEWGYELPTRGFSGNHLRKGTEAKFKEGLAKLQKEQKYGNVIRYKKGDDPKNPNANGFERFCNEVGLVQGAPFKVEEGKSYPIEIMISEFGGGAFGFFLLIEECDKDGKSLTTTKAKSGAPIFQIFRTNFSNPSHENIVKMVEEDNKKSKGKPFNKGWNNDNLEGPPYDEDSLIWTAVPN